MTELDDLEVFYLRQRLNEEVRKLPQCIYSEPESKDFEFIKLQMLSHIAYKIWEKNGKPQNNDLNIWCEAEKTWNFIRHMWY